MNDDVTIRDPRLCSELVVIKRHNARDAAITQAAGLVGYFAVAVPYLLSGLSDPSLNVIMVLASIVVGGATSWLTRRHLLWRRYEKPTP